MLIIQLLFCCFLILETFCFSSMEKCLQDPNGRKEIDQTYGKQLTTVVMAYYPDLLKEINTVPNLIISADTTSFHFSSIAVDYMTRTFKPECKSTIKPFSYFPFSYVYQGETEAQGKYLNMNCFFVDYEQYTNLQKCISPDFFNIYSINKDKVVNWTERKCKRIIGIKVKCWNEDHSRVDIVQDRIICYKQTNKVYDAFVEIAKMDLMSLNGGKVVNNLFQELPAEGTHFLNTCIPNCQSCLSFEKCNQCKPQYSLVKNKCIKCFETCESCSLENNSSGCLTCKEKLVFYENQCLEQCPPGFIDQNRVCIRCAEGCKKCYKTPSQCNECQNEFVLQDEKCQKNCNDGFFLNIETQKCNRCSLGCKDCSSDQNCVTCENELMNKNGECKCNDGFYLNIDKKCSPCSHGCKDCSSDQNCITCGQDFIRKSEKECVEKCMRIENCEICDNEICQQCIQSKILIQYLDRKTVCDNKCPNNFQQDKICLEIKIKETTEEGSNMIKIILSICLPSLFIIALIAFCIFCIYRRRQLKQSILNSQSSELKVELIQDKERVEVDLSDISTGSSSPDSLSDFSDSNSSIHTQIFISDNLKL